MSLISALLLLLALATGPAFALTPATLDEIRLQIETPNRHAKKPFDYVAFQGLITAEPAIAPSVAAILAFHYRSVGDPEKMKDILKTYALKADGSWNTANADTCLEYARTISKESPKLVGVLLEQFYKGTHSRLKVLAGETAGDLALELGDPKVAIDYYNATKKFAASDEYAKEEKRVALSLARIEASLARAKAALDIKKYGEDFVLYRKAEKERLDENDYAAAFATYASLIQKFPTGVYADASRMYQGYCLKEQKKTSEAIKHWKDFCATDSLGLYRGEAMIEMAEMQMTPFTAEAAKKNFESCERWLEHAGAAERLSKLSSAPDKSKLISKPPQNSFHVDKLGNVLDADIQPGQLVNEKTCPWYLDSLRTRCSLGQGFFKFVEGDFEKASAQFKAVEGMDAKVSAMMKLDGPNMVRRLLVRCEQKTFRRARMEDLSGFQDPNRRFTIYLADFYAECERTTEAVELYRKLVNNELGKLNSLEEAYVRFGLCWSLWYGDAISGKHEHRKEAIKLLERFIHDKNLRETPIAPRTLNALANIYSHTEKDQEVKSREVYRLVIKLYPAAPEAEAASLFLSRSCLYNYHNGLKDKRLLDEGIRLLNEMSIRWPKGEFSVLRDEDLAKEKELLLKSK